MERASSTSHVGNIYKGRVTNVEPSIQAAFIDFGLGRNGFLHISDLMPSYFGHKGEDFQESVGRKIARRDRPPIQRCLRRGDDIIVQIIKEGIGTKGPTLSTYVSIPGRILVMMPGMSKFGISRKIEDETERKRLRGILDSLKPIKDVGFIIRTAGVGKTKTEIQRDLMYLTRLWTNIQKKLKQPAPQELYTEGDLVTRTVRDVFSSDIDRIVVDNDSVAKTIKEFFKIAMPRTKNRVEMYDEPIPLFHKYGIEREIEEMYSRHVPLPSGGSLVIDSTEAIVAIDVNSGKFRDHADAETTAFKTDLEAADEIPRQLRLRDLGGVIICDFIDLRYERHRRELERKLHENLRNDRAKTKVLRMSQFGIIEMTRQRMRPSLKRSIYFDCPHCKGSGLVKTPESMSLDVMRRLAIAAHDQRVHRVQLAVCPEVAFYLLNRKRGQLAEIEHETQKRIIVRHEMSLGLDEIKLELFDQRDGLLYLDSLGMAPQAHPEDRHRRHQPPGQRRGQPRHPQRGPNLPTPDLRHEQGEPFDRDDADERNETEEIEETEETTPTRDEESVEAIAESNVEDVDEASEPMGDAPEAIDEPRRDDGGPGRRRRRRGRRGRGGGRGLRPPAPENAPQSASAAPRSALTPAPVVDDAAEETEESDDTLAVGKPPPDENGPADGEQPRRRRRRRGGRRHRRKKNGRAGNGNAPEGDSATAVGQPARPPSHPRAAAPPIVKTGSTDRHLIEDEAAAPEPARRPRTYRDLDSIPDDFD
jgi:ribonuclease E